MKQLWKEERAGWKRWEVTWLLISCAVILGLSLYWQDTPMGILSAILRVGYLGNAVLMYIKWKKEVVSHAL